MGVKETNIQEERPWVVLWSLKKLANQVFHVCDVAATLQKIAVQFGVGEIKWINLDKGELEKKSGDCLQEEQY